MGSLAGVTLAAVGAVIATLLFTLRRMKREPVEPGCGRCGYPARGLPTFTCPECGCDLREVGIVRRTPGPRRKVAWAGICVLLAVVLATLILRFARQRSVLLARTATATIAVPKGAVPVTVGPADASGSQVRVRPGAQPVRLSTRAEPPPPGPVPEPDSNGNDNVPEGR